MRAKVCYTLSTKLYHKCKPIATNRRRFSETTSRFEPPTGAARSRIDRMIAAASRASCARPYGTPWTRLLRRLATATPCTACPLLPKHTLRATMKIPLLRHPPILNSMRNISSDARRHEALTGGSLPFETVIERNTIPASRLVCDRPFFKTQAGGCARWRTASLAESPA